MKSAEELYAERPRSAFARWSSVAIALLVVLSWTSGAFDFGALATDRARQNLGRFLMEVRPYPLQGAAWDWHVARAWFSETTAGKLAPALLDTLAFSVAAIVLAALVALAASSFAAQSLTTPEPFLPGAWPPTRSRRWLWNALVWSTRSALIVVRSIPEYVWAFMILILLGPGAWPGVLALALHNSGILGKLFAEVVENGDPHPPRALRALGAGRFQITTTSIWPDALGRFLLYFFYRWETCVREATILGLLGFSGLGYYILQAKASIKWDEMVLWTLMGSLLIVAGDLVSVVLRSWIRRAG